MPLRPRRVVRRARHRAASLGARGGRPSTRKSASVTCDNGRSYEYDRLLIATGAEPVKLAHRRRRLARVHYLRTLDDSRADHRRGQEGARAVVVGASFIGLEVAASLRARRPRGARRRARELPLGRVMGKELGGVPPSLHEEHGVEFHLGRKPRVIEASGDGALSVRLDDGSRLALRLRRRRHRRAPGDRARGEGRARDRRRHRRRRRAAHERPSASSPPATSRAIPIARTGGRIRVEHWVVAQRQGQTAARNMLGARRAVRRRAVLLERALRRRHQLRRPRRVGSRGTIDGDPAARTVPRASSPATSWWRWRRSSATPRAWTPSANWRKIVRRSGRCASSASGSS